MELLLEAEEREKEYPLGRGNSILGTVLMCSGKNLDYSSSLQYNIDCPWSARSETKDTQNRQATLGNSGY